MNALKFFPAFMSEVLAFLSVELLNNLNSKCVLECSTGLKLQSNWSLEHESEKNSLSSKKGVRDRLQMLENDPIGIL